MAPRTQMDDFPALRKPLDSIRALVSSFHAALECPPGTVPTPSDGAPNAFAVLTDASKLLRAQITKLSLLVINQPFSPKEVAFILNALSTSVLPALMSALELCHPETHTRALHDHIRTSLRVLWRELGSFLSLVPENEAKAKQIDDKAAVPSAGLIWGHCDALIEIGQGGLVKYVDAKVKGYGDLFEDAIAELEEWDPDDEDDGESDYDSDGKEGDDSVVHTPTTSDEEKLGQGMAQMAINPQYELKSKVMKRLRLIKLLYPAIRKRRIATFPVLDGSRGPANTIAQISKLDAIIQHMQHFTDIADELAAALYDNVVDNLESRLREMSDEALQLIQLTKPNWIDSEDEFSVWLSKWNDRFRSVCGATHDIP